MSDGLVTDIFVLFTCICLSISMYIDLYGCHLILGVTVNLILFLNIFNKYLLNSKFYDSINNYLIFFNVIVTKNIFIQTFVFQVLTF